MPAAGDPCPWPSRKTALRCGKHSGMNPPPDNTVERLDLAQSPDRLQVALHQQRYDFVLARLLAEDSVLEVGTGTGGFSRMIIERCQAYAGLEYRCRRL